MSDDVQVTAGEFRDKSDPELSEIKVAHDPDADPYFHPIADEILEAIEMMARHAPDVESGDVEWLEVVEFWMTAFHEHAKAAVEGARREMAWKEIER